MRTAGYIQSHAVTHGMIAAIDRALRNDQFTLGELWRLGKADLSLLSFAEPLFFQSGKVFHIMGQ